jgi:TRAP-type transport system small permease protein
MKSAPAAPLHPEQWIGALTMALLVLITGANVVVRYLTDRSFAWTEEISVFLLIVLTLAGSAWAATRDGHIRIEYLYMRGSEKQRSVLRWLSRLATAGIFFLLAVLAARACWSEFSFGETTAGLGLPRWWYTAWIPPLTLWVAVRAWSARDALKIADEAGNAP